MPTTGLTSRTCLSCGESFLLADVFPSHAEENLCPTCSELIKDEELVMTKRDDLRKEMEEFDDVDENAELADDLDVIAEDSDEEDESYAEFVSGLDDPDDLENEALDDDEFDEAFVEDEEDEEFVEGEEEEEEEEEEDEDASEEEEN